MALSQHQHQSILDLLSKIDTNHRRNISETSFRLLQNSPKSADRKEEKSKQKLSISKQPMVLKSFWRSSGSKQLVQPFQRLGHKYELDNWEISRIPLSNRSFAYPKKYKGIKIPQKSKQFSTYDSKDKDGHLPYLYPNEINKIQSIKYRLSLIPFKRTNTIKSEYFGFGKRQSIQIPKTKQKLSSHSYLHSKTQRSNKSYL